MPALSPDVIYRDYVVAGDSGSGAHNPDKADIRQYLNQLENGQGARLDTKADLEGAEISSFVKDVELNGYTAVGDGGGAAYVRVDAEPSHAGKVRSTDRYLSTGIEDATNGGWWEIASSQVNLRMFGAVGDGGTPDTTAVNNAIYWAMSTDNVLYMPEGDFFIPADVGLTLTNADKSLVLVGEGAKYSRFIFDNLNYNDVNFMTQGAPVDRFEMRDLSIIGSFGTSATYAERKNMIFLGNVNEVVATRCRLAGSYSGAFVTEYADSVTVTDCEFENNYRDSCRHMVTRRAVIKGNKFVNCLDDSIAISTYDPTSGSGCTLPDDNSVVITNNVIVDSSGIACFGAKKPVISNNIITRPISRAIAIGATGAGFETGNTPILGAVISGNVITDPFLGSAFDPAGTVICYCIEIISESLVAKDIVGTYDGVSAVYSPRPYLYNQDVDETGIVNAGHYNIIISNNSMHRTLDATTNYSDYGFGERLSRVGWVDPEITDADLASTHINIESSGRGLLITGNISTGAEKPLRIARTAATNGVAFHDYKVTNNQFIDYDDYGVTLVGDGMVEISGNTFNADPYFRHVQRTSPIDGSWTASYAQSSGIYIASASGLSVISSNNTFENVGIPINTAGGTNSYISTEDCQICDPDTAEYFSGNKGIGYVHRPALMPRMIVKECDPTVTATYNTIKNVCLNASATMPTSGTYVTSHFVRNVGASSTVYGWKRITNGSSHVLNTNWVEIG